MTHVRRRELRGEISPALAEASIDTHRAVLDAHAVRSELDLPNVIELPPTQWDPERSAMRMDGHRTIALTQSRELHPSHGRRTEVALESVNSEGGLAMAEPVGYLVLGYSRGEFEGSAVYECSFCLALVRDLGLHEQRTGHHGGRSD